jgi:competence protein ComEC
LQRMRNISLSKDASSICSALITGYDADVDNEVTNAFAHTGTIHILAVSGLHTGLIYLAIDFLFGLADRRNRFRITRFITASILLWFFALITGFSAPVLRAVIMFTLLGAGRTFNKGNVKSVNILLVSAFFMLLYNPFYIMETGFLLSYLAVAGILVFQPSISGLLQPSAFFPKYLWQSTSVSVAATIGTLPVTLFLFKQFPLSFIVCNLVLIPLSFVLLILSFLALFHVAFISQLVNLLVTGMIGFLQLFNRKGMFIEGIDFTFIDGLFLSMLILLALFAIRSRNYRMTASCCVLLIAWQLFSLYSSYEAKNTRELTVYSLRNSGAVSVKYGNNVALYMDSAAPFRRIYPHLISMNYPTLNQDKFNYVKSGGTEILLLGQKLKAASPSISILIARKNIELNDRMLEEYPTVGLVIADASNSRKSLRRIKGFCNGKNIRFISTAEKAVVLSLDEI